MADTTTTNLNLTKPEVSASNDTWGTKLNADLDAIDALFTTGPALLVTKGGTGATTAAAARTNLGVAIGSNVQAWDADLDAIAAIAGTSGLLRKTAANTWSLETTAYAPLASPALTGTPTAPTAAVDTNTTQIATTAYVVGQGYLKSSTALSTYAPLASPALTGTPTAPTAAGGTNTTQVATTAFVQAAVAAGSGHIENGAGGVGYGTGSGGTVTQLTSKSTGVTLNKTNGQIVTSSSNMAAGATEIFTVTNSTVAATDTIIIHRASGGTNDRYRVGIDAVAAGSFVVVIQNYSGGALAQALTLNFAVIKAVTS